MAMEATALIVTLRMCQGCDPMIGDARILLRRGDDVVATNGDPFGRFFDLPAGEYAVVVETALFERGPVTATVPASGPGRVEVLLDAGWLVGAVVSEPSGAAVTRPAGLAVQPLGGLEGDQHRGMEAEGVMFEGVAEALSVPTADLRLFGKPEAFERRRMGVALARGADTDQARERATEAAGKVRVVRP